MLLSRLPIVVLLALTAGACAARTPGPVAGPVPRPFPGAPGPAGREPPVAVVPPPAAPEAGDAGEDGPTLPASTPPVVMTALSYRGVPYRYGGSDPSTGFDCSGFVQYVYALYGLRLPREVRDQYREGDRIDRDEIQPGDLIFFETIGRGASHVGVAIGGDRFVHAPSSNGVVRVERFTSSYWAPRFVGARRLQLPEAQAATN